jgi:nucleoside 2-deoxyribosyltransferase
MRIYLGGPINGCSDDEAHGWRDAVKPLLALKGYDCVNPMDRDYRGREMEPGIVEEIVELDKKDIDSCEVLLMACPKPSVGTSMEVFYGWQACKKVICVVPKDHTPSPWLVYHSDHVFRGSVEDAVRELL